MKSSYSPKRLLRAVLSGTYTSVDLREFVQLCYSLALPLIRKKILQGKLNLETLGLKELDIVYDCLGELFHRDNKGGFPQIQSFFREKIQDIETCSDEELLVGLRNLIFGKVNNNVIRLYAEADPTLGRILRNLKLALDRSRVFEQVTRFGDVYLVARGIDAHWHLPPLPYDYAKQEFSHVVLIHDNVPVMLRKLHDVMVRQEEFQRSLPLVTAAVLMKEIYALGWEPEEPAENGAEPAIEADEVVRIIDKVIAWLREEMYPTYVISRKCSDEVFGKYIESIREILISTYVEGSPEGFSYYEFLRSKIPKLTKGAYAEEHRTILEYLAKVAKGRVREELRKI